MPEPSTTLDDVEKSATALFAPATGAPLSAHADVVLRDQQPHPQQQNQFQQSEQHHQRHMNRTTRSPSYTARIIRSQLVSSSTDHSAPQSPSSQTSQPSPPPWAFLIASTRITCSLSQACFLTHASSFVIHAAFDCHLFNHDLPLPSFLSQPFVQFHAHALHQVFPSSGGTAEVLLIVLASC